MSKLLLTKLILAGVIATITCTLVKPVSATKIPVKYNSVSTADAIKGAIPITLYFGKIISIDFTDVEEYITFIAPSDRSQFVFNTDLPANSGEAQSVYLLPIKKLDFKGAYQTSHPNLIVKTINSLGESKQYNFIINFSSGVMASTGIKIVPPTKTAPIVSNKINVSAGQTINADAVEHGLRIAIAKQFVSSRDPLVNQVRNFIFMLRNAHSVNEAIVATGVNPSVIESLGEMYLEAELPPRLRPKVLVTSVDAEVSKPDGAYLQPLIKDIEKEQDEELQAKLYQVFAELEAGKNPRQTIEKYQLSPKWFGKIMRVYLAHH